MSRQILRELLDETLVFDIETSAFHDDGSPVNIKKEFDEYVKRAKVKWVGCYSYKYNKYYEFNAIKERLRIIELFNEHKTYVGVNNEAFDTPIMKNNGLIDKKYFKQVDVQVCLGIDQNKGHKSRSVYMGVNLKKIKINGKFYGPNTLMSLAYHFKLDVLKGDIDYKIFYRNNWSIEEEMEIKKYLHADVEITKKLFDKMIDFWKIFIPWLYEEDVKRWSWLKTTIASMTYLSACRVKGVKPTYADRTDEKEDMGGRAIEPVQAESWWLHYMDEASKYPHTFAEFNLCSEVDVSKYTPETIQQMIDDGKLFHGNEMFKVKGYYDITEQGVMEKDIIKKLKTRFAIKKVLKNHKKRIELKEIPEELKSIIKTTTLDDYTLKILNGLQYAIKIFLNAYYGVVRSPVFEQIHTEWAGYDCCWIGQQIHEYVEKFFVDRGYKIVGGFTDSWFFEMKEEEKDLPQKEREQIMKDLAEQCMNELKKYMPFPAKTHIIDYEMSMDYILYYFNKKEQRYMKNNYCYISGDKVKIVGFPIMKDNATKLSMKIFNKYLKPFGIKNKSLRFEKDYIEGLIKKELEEDITQVAVTYKVNPSQTYKSLNQLQAQISRAYLDGESGTIDVIKNNRIGKVGKKSKYCNIEEAKNLRYEDLVLDKLWNELEPFIIEEKPIDLMSFDESENNDKDDFDDFSFSYKPKKQKDGLEAFYES